MRAADATHDVESPLAGPFLRVVAYCVDPAVHLGPSAVILAGVLLHNELLLDGGLIVAALSLAAMGVANLILLARFGQTVGKRLLGLRIVRSDGRRAGLFHLLLWRYAVPAVVTVVPVIGVFYVLADAGMLLSPTRRTLHDLIADTIVIDLRRSPPDDPGPSDPPGESVTRSAAA